MNDYWKRVKQNLNKFWQAGDNLLLTDIYADPGQDCQLCGHFPIKWNYILMNTSTSDTIRVGSKCIRSIKQVVRDMGHDVMIEFPFRFVAKAEGINQKQPGTVFVKLPKYHEPEDELDSYIGYIGEELDVYDAAPEGTGCDDIDWDSHDYE